VPYAAVGPSAHAFDGETRRWNVPAYAEWVRALAAGREPAEGTERLTAQNRLAESVYLGLRTDEGLSLQDDAERDRVESWVRAGWAQLEEGDTRLRLTALGWLRLDSLAATLTDQRSRYNI